MSKYRLPIKCKFELKKNEDEGLWEVWLLNIDPVHVAYGAAGRTPQEALNRFAMDLPNQLIQ